jgi:hypothetical protein
MHTSQSRLVREAVMREPDAGRYVHIRPRWLPPECHPQPAPLHVRPDRQGMRDRAEARPRQAGPRRTAQAMNDLDQLRVKLRALMASWEVRVRDGARLLGRRPPAASGGAREGGAPAREDRRAHAEPV